MTRILIVEDSATQAQMLQLILEGEGFTVDVADSAEAALVQLEKARYDVLISDIVMPGRTGYDLCRAVKADRAHRDLPVVLLTTLSDPMDIIEGLESGADNFLTKPYDAAKLVHRIRTILENKHLRGHDKLKANIEIMFLGRRFVVGSDKEQILDLLLSTFEDTVRTNQELQRSQAELAAAKAKLELDARQMEQRARTSEEHFRTLVESMDDIIYTLDREQRYTGIFGRWLATEGWQPAQYLGKTAREVFGAEAAAIHEDANARALAGTRVQYDWCVGASQSTRHFQSVLSPIRDEAGQVIGLVGVGRETTEQKKLQSQLMASDRMVSVGVLAAGVAHEINNPLAAVMANLDLAVQDAADLESRFGPLGELVEELRDARAGAERVRQIVRDLRVFSRTEEETRGPVDVQAVMESTIRMAWNEIRHRARLVKSYSDVPAVEANDARLGQVFLNLLINAAQAISVGHADKNEIRVAIRAIEASRRVVVEITDTGSGIPPGVLQHLFTPFFTTKAAGVGTGLGLSICQRIVTGFGGEIAVDSEPGRGTTVTVVLPASSSVAGAATAPERAIGAARKGRVLVVDDEPMICKTVRRTLEGEHEVTTVSRAGEALAAITGGARFDVILCDLMMPELTGMDLHAELQRVAADQAARMIFLTGGAFTPRTRQFLEAVSNLRLEKPFEPAHLRSLVNDRMK